MSKLDELEAMEKAAWPGPWKREGGLVIGPADEAINPDVRIVAECWPEDHPEPALIAAARNALPDLIAVCRAAQEVNRCCALSVGREVRSCGRCAPCRLAAALARLATP